MNFKAELIDLIKIVVLTIVIIVTTLMSEKTGYKAGYNVGYIKALTNQQKGLDHDFVLKENSNGETVWFDARKGN